MKVMQCHVSCIQKQLKGLHQSFTGGNTSEQVQICQITFRSGPHWSAKHAQEKFSISSRSSEDTEQQIIVSILGDVLQD
jgi:hypothetical protein